MKAAGDLALALMDDPALVLSGAGLSTESGIPDYRSPQALARKREPMRYQLFRTSSRARRHYWARSHVAWQAMRTVRPNPGHFAVRQLELAGAVTGVITQNVDGLHQAAGSEDVLELHGTLSRVRCLDCGEREGMDAWQARLGTLNPGFTQLQAAANPDGDAELTESQTAAFNVAHCLNCGGVMKTDVVFFGENVPVPVVERAWALLEAADSLLVLGSSLTVWSGYRFAEGAVQRGKPLFIINDGPTRADGLAVLKLSGRLGTVLPAVAAAFSEAATGARRGTFDR